jgi:hypothetical protein
MEVEIKRPHWEQYEPRKVQSVKPLERNPSHWDDVIRVYQQLLETFHLYNVPQPSTTTVLHPKEIDKWLQTTISDEQHPNYTAAATNTLGNLVKNAWQSGHTKFSFHPPHPSISVGNFCKPEEHIEIDVYGDIGNSGIISKKTTLRIYGSVGRACGEYSQDCTFELYGDIGRRPGKSRDCTYKTTEQGTLEELVTSVIDTWQGQPSGNKIIFIHEDGSEELVRHYGN